MNGSLLSPRLTHEIVLVLGTHNYHPLLTTQMSPSQLIHTVCYALIGFVYLCLGIHYLYPGHFFNSICSFALVVLYTMLAVSELFHSAGPRVRHRGAAGSDAH